MKINILCIEGSIVGVKPIIILTINPIINNSNVENPFFLFLNFIIL